MYAILLLATANLDVIINQVIVNRDNGVTEVQATANAKSACERSAVNLMYIKSHVSDASRRDLVISICNNKEVIRGYQHPRERSEWGTGGRGRHERDSHSGFEG